MTSQEALEGVQRLQRHFGVCYKGADLNPVWPDLLGCSAAAFGSAVGFLIMHGKFLPAPDYVLHQTRQWEKRLRTEGAAKMRGMGVEDLGRESLRLTRGHMDGTLPLRDYIAGLYLLSERTGQVEYAEEAMRKERRLMNEGGHDETAA